MIFCNPSVYTNMQTTLNPAEWRLSTNRSTSHRVKYTSPFSRGPSCPSISLRQYPPEWALLSNVINPFCPTPRCMMYWYPWACNFGTTFVTWSYETAISCVKNRILRPDGAMKRALVRGFTAANDGLSVIFDPSESENGYAIESDTRTGAGHTPNPVSNTRTSGAHSIWAFNSCTICWIFVCLPSWESLGRFTLSTSPIMGPCLCG